MLKDQPLLAPDRIGIQDMPERDQAHQHQFFPSTIQAAVRARVQERTGRCDMPDIIDPVIMAGGPLTSAGEIWGTPARNAITGGPVVFPPNIPGKTAQILFLEMGVEGEEAPHGVPPPAERAPGPKDS